MSSGAGGPRLVVVLGYSGHGGELHEICAARLRRAEQEARPDDVVLLSGWSRSRRRATEAELMAHAWNGRCSRLILDHGARTTLANVVGAFTVATDHGAREIVLVTSRWHLRRAASLLEAAAAGSEIEIGLAATEERGSLRTRLREAACWTIVPFQRRVATARGRARRRPLDDARVEAT